MVHSLALKLRLEKSIDFIVCDKTVLSHMAITLAIKLNISTISE